MTGTVGRDGGVEDGHLESGTPRHGLSGVASFALTSSIVEEECTFAKYVAEKLAIISEGGQRRLGATDIPSSRKDALLRL